MNESIFNGYAIALFELSKESKSELLIRNELNEIYLALKNNTEFIYILFYKDLINEQKFKIIDEVFNSCSELTLNYLKIIIKNNLSFYLLKVLEKTINLFDFNLNIETGYIYLSHDIDNETLVKIRKKLESKLNKTIYLTKKIDESLIGGFKVVLSNSVYDESLLYKYNKLKEYLKEEN